MRRFYLFVGVTPFYIFYYVITFMICMANLAIGQNTHLKNQPQAPPKLWFLSSCFFIFDCVTFLIQKKHLIKCQKMITVTPEMNKNQYFLLYLPFSFSPYFNSSIIPWQDINIILSVKIKLWLMLLIF